MERPIDERFARHTLVPGWDQARLQGAAVNLVGVGAVGNEVARLLALSGVGHLTLCDPDRIEITNLSRCALFREADVGRFKAQAAADALVALYPGMQVDAVPRVLVHGLGLAALRDADLTLSCLDTRNARLELAGRCALVRAPWIDGGTHAWGGEVRPYLDPDGPCYACGLTPKQRAVHDTPVSCLEQTEHAPVGATALASVLVGAWIGTLAVRFLLGLPVPPDLLKIDAVRGTVTPLPRRRDPSCPLHRPMGPVTRLPLDGSATLRALRAALPEGAVPLAWEPVQVRLECLACGHERREWGAPARTTCPECGAIMHPWTSIELTDLPGDVTLSQAGVAPREILAARVGDEIRWYELGGADPATPDPKQRQDHSSTHGAPTHGPDHRIL
jgi:molybdopterin/thiamine biosynthesis adenylyltransferase